MPASVFRNTESCMVFRVVLNVFRNTESLTKICADLINNVQTNSDIKQKRQTESLSKTFNDSKICEQTETQEIRFGNREYCEKPFKVNECTGYYSDEENEHEKYLQITQPQANCLNQIAHNKSSYVDDNKESVHTEKSILLLPDCLNNFTSGKTNCQTCAINENDIPTYSMCEYKHITITSDLHDYNQVVSNQMQGRLTAIEGILVAANYDSNNENLYDEVDSIGSVGRLQTDNVNRPNEYDEINGDAVYDELHVTRNLDNLNEINLVSIIIIRPNVGCNKLV